MSMRRIALTLQQGKSNSMYKDLRVLYSSASVTTVTAWQTAVSVCVGGGGVRKNAFKESVSVRRRGGFKKWRAG